jgi:hypothetical protein
MIIKIPNPLAWFQPKAVQVRPQLDLASQQIVPTVPLAKAEEFPMSFKSVLSVIGSDIKAVFAWIGSPKGQQVILTGEAAVETIFPAATGLINLANAGLAEILKVEALATGAAIQNGSGLQKLTAVTTAIAPEVLAYAQQHGLATPTSTEIQTAVNGLVAFANALNGAASVTVPVTLVKPTPLAA